MIAIIPPWPILTAFLAASMVLAVTPGPGVIYIITRCLSQGRLSGLASVAGVALGNLCNALGASLGLAALFAVSDLAFLIVKYLGAAYLLFVGIRTLRRSDEIDLSNPAAKQHQPVRKIFLDGFLVALLNPKTTLFFAAFLPQFVRASSSFESLMQTITLGTVFVLVAIMTDTIYVLLSSSLNGLLQRQGTQTAKWGKCLSGGVFIVLGLLTLIAGHKH